ncbi:NAD(P)-dependent oxidoreductase [Phaeacidiphilus oryzae]|uniref:NAD(P)-dependent oxidoreductase n=1 Tax=Phaeacidiphilus oryzae TaxID=348818 RepID=UPI001F1F683B|nr:NAD(P)-dependent oxidoreductase [Phaeacidiphilus oryzae]
MDALAALNGMRPERLTGARVVVGPELSEELCAGLAGALAGDGVPVSRWDPADGGDGPLVYVGGRPAAELRGDPRLVWFHSASAGVDAALSGGWPEGVLLTRTVGRMAERMAQYVLGWVLAEAQHVPVYLRQQADRVWLRRPGELVAGRTAVVFGAGSIGSEIGGLLRRCGVRTVGIARTARPDRSAEGFDRLLTLDQAAAEGVLDEARWVVGVLPLTAGTRGYFDRGFFDRLGARPSFLNLGRGAAVDLPALAAALESDRVRSAVLDVVPEEPAGPDALCWRLPRTVVTSHSSGVTDDEDVIRDLVAARRALASGGLPALTVDPARGY